MSAARLATGIWVAAYLARLGQRTIPAYVIHRGDDTAGAVAAIYGGLVSAVGLVMLSPVVSGKPAGPDGKSTSLITDPTIDFSIFPLENPGLVSIPFGFFCGWLGTVLSKEHNEAKYAEMEVRSLTGVGSEKATSH